MFSFSLSSAMKNTLEGCLTRTALRYCFFEYRELGVMLKEQFEMI